MAGKGYQSGHDTVFFGTTAQRNGLTALNVAAGEQNWPSNAAANVWAKQDCNIIGYHCITEAIANCDEYRWHTANDADWNRTMFHKADQTADYNWNALVGKCNYRWTKGEQFNVELDNDNAAQLEIVTFNVANKADNDIAGQPFGVPPQGSFWVMVTAATATVADTVTRSALTFTNYAVDREKRYRVYGARFWAADLYAFRLITVDSDDAPGGPGSDTEICGSPTFWKPFGCEFSGLNGLWADFVSEGADTAIGALLISEV